MAQIDLKNVTLTIEDGSAKTATVNNSGGYTTGATTMLIGTITTAIATGAVFTVAGETGLLKHTVTSHTETSGATTSITFAPALAGAVANNAIISFGPNNVILRIGEGSLDWTEKQNVEYVKDRGLIYGTRLGDQEPVDVSFDFIYEMLTSDSTNGELPTVNEALGHYGACANWLSTGVDPCEPYAVNIRAINAPLCTGGTTIKTEVVLLQYFRWEEKDFSMKDGKVSVKGKCNVNVVIPTRV